MRILGHLIDGLPASPSGGAGGIRISWFGWGSAALVSLLLWQLCFAYLIR